MDAVANGTEIWHTTERNHPGNSFSSNTNEQCPLEILRLTALVLCKVADHRWKISVVYLLSSLVLLTNLISRHC